MGEEELHEEIKELKAQIAELSDALETAVKPYQKVLGQLEELQGVARRYFGLLELYQRFGEISPEVVIPGLKDPISQEIVKILFDKGDRNISQIADQMRQRRGSASRRIVRERLEKLVEDGIVTVSAEGKQRRFSISDEVVQKWSQLLGLHKYEGQDSNTQGKKESE
jgi:DNA-binding transcriptional ArsR family regulator